jgi:K+-sensing histidine kinase KdpD
MVARLEAAFARQKRFVADVSHELRTPLTGLGGSLEMLLLRAGNGDEEIAHRLMGGMYAEVERMQRLVADLLALTKLDEGRVRLQVEAVAVSALVNEVCEQVQGLVDGQELSAQVPPDLPVLRGNADQLRRVLLNIVENALKFTPLAGCVELVARKESAEFIRLEVRDTGIGISPVSLPYVFDRFYRSDPSRTRSSLQAGGSGLGLSMYLFSRAMQKQKERDGQKESLREQRATQSPVFVASRGSCECDRRPFKNGCHSDTFSIYHAAHLEKWTKPAPVLDWPPDRLAAFATAIRRHKRR